MAVIETWLTQDLKKPVQVQSLCGNFFSHNGNANRIGVRVYDDGEPATLSGTVSGYAVLPDGTTVPCTGTLSGNSASVLLPAAAYVPGNICVTIMLTSGTTITTLAALTGSVVMARTDTQVNPGSVVTDWTNTINAALQTVEGYTGNIIATPYASLTYPVPLGKYCIYNNLLYRCIVPIATSEEFTAAHWSRVFVGDEITNAKDAYNDNDSEVRKSVFAVPFVSSSSGGIIEGGINSNGANNTLTTRGRTYYVRIETGKSYSLFLDSSEYIIINAFTYSGTTAGSMQRKLTVSEDGKRISFRSGANDNYIRISFAHNDKSATMTEGNRTSVQTAFSYNQLTDEKFNIIGVPADAKATGVLKDRSERIENALLTDSDLILPFSVAGTGMNNKPPGAVAPGGLGIVN